MKWSLCTLVIEVTRRCNMECPHCLRGNAQNLDIDTAYIDRLLDDVSNISSITFSGGEPSLNIQAIEYTLEQCIARHIPVGSFYIVTNGKMNALPLAIVCLKWYAYCDDDEMCGLALSKDMFHDEINSNNEFLLRGLSFFREDKFVDWDRSWLLDEGRATDLSGFKKKYPNMLLNESLAYDLDIECVESMIYLSANGEIRTNCDTAYENDNFTIGTLADETFSEMIFRTAEEEQAIKEMYAGT